MLLYATSSHFSTAKLSSQQVHHCMSLNLKFLNYNYIYKPEPDGTGFLILIS